MALARRIISVTFQLATGSKPFNDADGSNSVTLDGLRTSAKITKAGGAAMSTLDLRMYGMTKSVMDKLNTLGMAIRVFDSNYVTVQAGDDVNGVATVFYGSIVNCWADFQAQPDVALNCIATEGLIPALKPSSPRSYTGPADVAVILSGIAQEIGYDFENNGVKVILPKPYFFGSPRNQAYAAAKQANIGIALDNKTLAIWNLGEARGGQIPLISPTTGMVGYPAYTSKGIAVKTVFNPAIGFQQKINIESSLTQASGEWTVYGLAHDLEANTPNGQWFTMLEASRHLVTSSQ